MFVSKLAKHSQIVLQDDLDSTDSLQYGSEHIFGIREKNRLMMSTRLEIGQHWWSCMFLIQQNRQIRVIRLGISYYNGRRAALLFHSVDLVGYYALWIVGISSASSDAINIGYFPV